MLKKAFTLMHTQKNKDKNLVTCDLKKSALNIFSATNNSGLQASLLYNLSRKVQEPKAGIYIFCLFVISDQNVGLIFSC